MSASNIELFHVREERLQPGEIIHPGRWGATVLGWGKDHPFYFREHLLEIWRTKHTSVSVSRCACTFAHQGIEQAQQYRADGEFIYRVVPVDSNAPNARLDMLWLTWMGEKGATSDKVAQWCAAYWSGQSVSDLLPGATTAWEWLFLSPLRVEEIVSNRN